MIIKKNSLIVSCQAEGDDPFNNIEGVTLFARAAEMGGADCIRSEGVAKTKSIIKNVNTPVIGLVKNYFKDGYVCITRKLDDVKKLIQIGCKIISIDGTFRNYQGLTGAEFIQKVKKIYDIEIMADISTFQEAFEMEKCGVDYISTTLNGYTKETKMLNNGQPNFELIKQIVERVHVPVFSEGRISSIDQAGKMIDLGAYGVVIGTWITRPRIVTEMYKKRISK